MSSTACWRSMGFAPLGPWARITMSSRETPVPLQSALPLRLGCRRRLPTMHRGIPRSETVVASAKTA